MKIIAANGSTEDKSQQICGIINAEDDAGLHYHQHGTNGNEKTGENEKVEGFPEHWLNVANQSWQAEAIAFLER
jgi:hypothetical protein